MKPYPFRSLGRAVLFVAALTVGGAAALAPTSAPAVILSSSQGNVSPPADDPGFDNVGFHSSAPTGGRSLVYLGDSWVLTTIHGGFPSRAFFADEEYDLIPNTEVRLQNPAGSGLSSGTDLRMFRINGNPDLPSLEISASPPPIGAEVTMIGRGLRRPDELTHWDFEWEETSGSGAYRGYKMNQSPIKEMRWGTNRIEDDFRVVGDRDPGHTAVIQLRFGGVTWDIISLLTLWDEIGGTPHEAQAVSGDSGGGVFYKRGGQWELAGIMNAVLTLPDQPRDDWSVFGQGTASADLSSYRSEILSIMADPNYSIMGDIDLDGVVGDDDLTAFAEGWMTEHPIANIDSWKLGDLNQDAVTNLHDFRLLRNAYPAASSIVPALGLPSSVVIPEPTSTALLMLGGAAAWMLFRRRRR